MMNAEPKLDFRSANALWASVLVETLVRAGVRRAVVSPGSRSTPLTLALAGHPQIEAIPVLDERSAGFFALGLAKVRTSPVVLVCTSGTAGANYFPAIIEARESGVPLIAITADRPPEMRECASGQTIDQQKLFGGFVNFYHELSVPEATEQRLVYLRQTILHACERSLSPTVGPVHINAPFRDPLVPPSDGAAAVNLDLDWGRFFGHIRGAAATRPVTHVPQIDPEARGLIVVGNEWSDERTFPQQIGVLAAKLGWPVLTDGLSPLRNHGAVVPNIVTTADLILRNTDAAEKLAPGVVICVGGWPTSKVLRAWLEEADPRIWMFSERLGNRDALHGRTEHFSGMDALVQGAPQGSVGNPYLQTWMDYERRARVALDRRLESMQELFEGKAAWLMARHLPQGTPMLVANSMPVRDVEYFWPPSDNRVRPLCNRGANGIDGTLSTALGIAHASGQPAVLLTGDLALLHDTNGFLITPKLRGSLTIVLINNGGGGIFEHLPVAKTGDLFEEYFATPQKAKFAGLTRAYGCEHHTPAVWEEFARLVGDPPVSGVRVLELVTDRKRDAWLRRQLFSDVAASLGAE